MLTLQYIPHHEIAPLNSENRIKKLLKVVKENKIVIMEGRLKPSEETTLIQKTMEEITKDFKGIELCTIHPSANNQFLKFLKRLMVKAIIGDREGITIIGPATIVKDIRRNPNRVELLTSTRKRRA